MKINKFRSWNKEHKCFFYFENGEYFYVKNKKRIKSVEALFTWNNAEQWIGRLGKNKQELFVGDKIVVPDRWYQGKQYYKTVIISYDEDTSCYCCYDVQGTYWGYHKFTFLKDFKDNDIEKIGNIHENTEFPK